DFGANVKIFDPTMPIADIQAAVDAVKDEQVDNEMGTARYALLFKPGTYGSADAPLRFQVGYYTEVAGLGKDPTDVTINGSVNVYNRCLAADNCIALDNFWRSLSNLSINVAGGEGCQTATNFWAVSQAAPMRRVNMNGNLSLMDYCSAGPQYASGGFIADSKTAGIVNGSQQQFLVRNSTIGTWSNGVWNQVFAGVEGAPAENFGAEYIDTDGNPAVGRYTTLPTTPASKERPYLYLNPSKGYNRTDSWNVFVPRARTNSTGTTWAAGPTQGRTIPLSQFFLAKPSDSVSTINRQLASGKNLIFTPGVYNINRSIQINRPDTIVLGLGITTLTAVNGAVPIKVGDVKGVDIAGIMIDAGTVNSPALLQIGNKHEHRTWRDRGHCSDPSDPTALQDVFFRIGGPHVGKATTSLVVNSDNVILDDIWAWRADHGVDGSVGWTINTAATGVVVHGDNVTATGLFVEHYQKYNVIWDGENGKTVFFQNELPYDAPDQQSWQHDGVLGWAAYKVADSVKTHELWGGGSYIVFNVDKTLHVTRAFEVPYRPTVRFHSLLTVQLNTDNGTVDHIINNTGLSTTTSGVPSVWKEFPPAA
ncbi:MAG: adenylyl cyclase, partial [Nakamurella sp.]